MGVVLVDQEEPTANNTEEDVEEEGKQEGFSLARAFTSLIMGFIVGGIAAWATTNMSISTISFFVVAIITTFLLYRKNKSSRYALGAGLYAFAIIRILTPPLFYIPMVIESEEADTAESAGTFIGSTLGMVIWGFVFLLFSIVTGAVGYFVRGRGS